MKQARGIQFKTISDVAIDLDISISTLRRYIRSGIFPPPKRAFFASQAVAIFSDEYVENAKKALEELRYGRSAGTRDD